VPPDLFWKQISIFEAAFFFCYFDFVELVPLTHDSVRAISGLPAHPHLKGFVNN
jgi:hypothetical protein